MPGHVHLPLFLLAGVITCEAGPTWVVFDGSGPYTYDAAKSKCAGRNGQLCTKGQYCPGGSLSSAIGGDAQGQTGADDRWSPYRDSDNGWIQTGTGSSHPQCTDHADFGAPSWGTSGSQYGTTMCCDIQKWTDMEEQKCKGTAWRIRGKVPTSDVKKPLAVYLHGSSMTYDHPASQTVLQRMADRDFVSVNIEHNVGSYPGRADCNSWKASIQGISACISNFCQDNAGGTLNLDCSLGVAMVGYSFGGQKSFLMHYSNPLVTAALSFSGTVKTGDEECWEEMMTLPKNKRRVVIANQDGAFGGAVSEGQMSNWGVILSGMKNGDIAAVKAKALLVSGYELSDCTNDRHCIQSDGSGFYVFTAGDHGQIPTGPGHHWLFTNIQTTKVFWTPFKDAAEETLWGLQNCLNWLGKAAREIPSPPSTQSTQSTPPPVSSDANLSMRLPTSFCIIAVWMAWLFASCRSFNCSSK